MQRIGIYGGTFNPPHIGHIRAAEYALQTMELSSLLVIPSCISPHKQLPAGSPTPQQRLKMLQLAFAEHSGIHVSDLELCRGGSSYTYETVEAVRNAYPDAEVFLLMGSDMFLSILNWKCPERILAQAILAVFCRGDKGEKETFRYLKEEVLAGRPWPWEE